MQALRRWGEDQELNKWNRWIFHLFVQGLNNFLEGHKALGTTHGNTPV